MRRTNEKDGSLTSEKSCIYKQINLYSALYSDLGMEYQKAHSGPFTDLSFRGGDAVIIAALKDGQISGYGRPVVASGNSKVLKREIQRLYDISPNIFYQDFLHQGNLSVISKFLIRKGAKVEPYYTQIIDLNQTEQELHQGIRKSYTSLINSRLLNTHIIDHQVRFEDILDTAFRKFKDLYHLKVDNPRPEETWDIQYEMIKTGEAFISADIEDGKLLSAGLFLHNEHCCYYGVGKSLPNVISHGTIWNAILHAKSLGLKTIELGEQVLYGEPKLVWISAFKAGFGGKTKTLLRIRSY